MLESEGIIGETLAGWGFTAETKSALLSLIKFELKDKPVLWAVIDRQGGFIIPGEAENHELVDQLARTALESLGRVAVPELGEMYRVATLPATLRQGEIAKRF